MAHKKRRVKQHIMEDQSLKILRDTLPEEWVVRDYKPDYGIDIAVEIFEYIDGSNSVSETLGEWFFAQVKSVEKTNKKVKKVNHRFNVEKGALKKDKKESLDIEVIPFQIDTDELLTVQAMGSGVPVLLILVTLDTGNIYFVCLNDIIDKCLIPEDPNFSNKKSKVIHIPIKNQITRTRETLVPIRFLAKRPKLYAAFSKFTYQEHEVSYILENPYFLNFDYSAEFPELEMLSHFIKIIKRYDFWETTEMWAPIKLSFDKIKKIELILNDINKNKTISKDILSPEVLSLIEKPGWDEDEMIKFTFRTEIQNTWALLKNLNNMYEEICREWFLPTFLAQISSYPD